MDKTQVREWVPPENVKTKKYKLLLEDKGIFNGKSPCHLRRENISRRAASLRKISYLFSNKPNPKKKGNKNNSIKQTASKYVSPDIKGYKSIIMIGIHTTTNRTNTNGFL